VHKEQSTHISYALYIDTTKNITKNVNFFIIISFNTIGNKPSVT